MKIYLVRHAQCLSNAGMKIESHNHLTDVGKEQAKRLGTYFHNVGINKIFCSASTRTRETLDYILPYLKCRDISYTKKIVEHYFGVYKDKRKFWDDARKSDKSIYEFKPKKGESFYDVSRRAQNFYSMLLKKHPKDNILIVSHNGFGKSFITKILSLDISEVENFIIGNASVSTFSIDAKGKVKNFHVSDFNHILKEGIKKSK